MKTRPPWIYEIFASFSAGVAVACLITSNFAPDTWVSGLIGKGILAALLSIAYDLKALLSIGYDLKKGHREA